MSEATKRKLNGYEVAAAMIHQIALDWAKNGQHELEEAAFYLETCVRDLPPIKPRPDALVDALEEVELYVTEERRRDVFEDSKHDERNAVVAQKVKRALATAKREGK